MPVVNFDALPDDARAWVFGAAAPVVGAAAQSLLGTVDAHLANWRAHGAPLVCAREWRDDRFLVIGVNEAATGATGCSIDGLFHVLRDIESLVGTTLVGGGTVYWRDAAGAVVSAARPAFREAAAAGAVVPETLVFDTTITTVGAYRSGFEKAAADSWHGKLLPVAR
ncbi:hypothetical protein [Gemmatimonas groenlandica]|uniref:ABC transporter ATPase n=1 Tax=Gemmatimonas groenlandica TaxID=2732249 RepID=A0A6M4IQK0_9BACT|nr:hypothetical protein [Gemmatimonas groenlandica]QJR36415.1 hypothetical protein HKW67_13335 [Gemmatimonas groenlandica]